jgi:hypothetical protein
MITEGLEGIDDDFEDDSIFGHLLNKKVKAFNPNASPEDFDRIKQRCREEIKLNRLRKATADADEARKWLEEAKQAKALVSRPGSESQSPEVKPDLASCLKRAQVVSDLKLRGKCEAVMRYNWYLKELSALKVATKKHQTPTLLKKQFPELEVWAVLDKDDERDIAAGTFDPGRCSWALVKRLNDLRGKDDRTLKNYRKALRAAGISV